MEFVPIDEVELIRGQNNNDSGVIVNGSPNGDNKAALMKKPSPPSEGKKRSKKIARQNSREGQPPHANGSLNGFIAPQRRWKNSRRSRNGSGRGMPKKNGGGGKGVWGLPGSEILEEPLEIDRNDPIYDPEINDGNFELKEVIAEKTPEEFFKLVEPIILEYFESGDTNDAVISLDEIVMGSLRPLVTTYSVQIALDHKDSQREMISVLISDLYGKVVTSRDIAKGKWLPNAFSLHFSLSIIILIASFATNGAESRFKWHERRSVFAFAGPTEKCGCVRVQTAVYIVMTRCIFSWHAMPV